MNMLEHRMKSITHQQLRLKTVMCWLMVKVSLSFTKKKKKKKKKKGAKKKITEMGKNNNATANLLDYEYFTKDYRLIAIDLSEQTELENTDVMQQINFIGRLDRDDGATMFFVIEKSEETPFDFSQNAASIT